MEFRPCIDIHNGQVKQIVGGSLKDQGDFAKENFVSQADASYYAKLYAQKGCKGGHVILLNSKDSPMYEATKRQAFLALETYPNGLQVGGGITADNAGEFLQRGASHVIVTSYVFHEGKIDWERLERLRETVGKEHIVLDLSCKKVGNTYRIVTDRWQNLTVVEVNVDTMKQLADYCDEFLIHAVDVEGKVNGIETDVVRILSEYEDKPVTYAGGVHSYEDILLLKKVGKGHVNVTVGSAMDLFGGKLSMEQIMKMIAEED